MKIFVKAKPWSREAYIKKIDGINFEVAVKEPPLKGKANKAIIKAIAEYFNVPDYQVKIVSGWSSRTKVVEVVQ